MYVEHNDGSVALVGIWIGWRAPSSTKERNKSMDRWIDSLTRRQPTMQRSRSRLELGWLAYLSTTKYTRAPMPPTMAAISNRHNSAAIETRIMSNGK